MLVTKDSNEERVLEFINKELDGEANSPNVLREIELFCKCMLGYVDFDAVEKHDCPILKSLYEKHQVDSLASFVDKIKWNYKLDYKTLLNVIDHFDMTPDVEKELSSQNTRIDKDYVHKKSSENVLLTDPVRVGNTLFYKCFNQSGEFNIDHPSDHLEGIVLFEVIRQVGLASAHHCDISLDGVIVILESDIQFLNYVEIGTPFFVQCIPAIRKKGGIGFSVFRVIQNGSTCAKGFFRAFVYKDRATYEKRRMM